MSISSETRSTTPKLGNGVWTDITFTFKVFDTDEIVLVQTTSAGVESTLTEGALNDYTVVLNTNQNTNPGGTITLTAVSTSGYYYTATSAVENLQPTQITNLGGFFPEVINNALDRLTILVQQVLNKVDRSIKIPLSDGTGITTELSTKTLRADKVLGFDSSGNVTALAFGSVVADFDAVLSGLAADDLIQYDGANWVNITVAELLTALGLGTASAATIGTSGATVPLLNANNTHSGSNTFSGTNAFSGVNTFSNTVNFSAAVVLDGLITLGATALQSLRNYLTPRGYISGLQLSNDTDTDHDILIQPGIAKDDTNAVAMVLSTAITKQIDANWAVGDDQGGLDTGTVANDTWYYVFEIMRSDTGVVDALISASESSPTMPANYDYKRCVGRVKTNGSANIIQFFQRGDWFYWDAPPLDVSVSNLGTTETLYTLSVPPGKKYLADIRYYGIHVSVGTFLDIYDPDRDDQAPSDSASPLAIMRTEANASMRSALIGTDTSGRVAGDSSASNTSLRIATVGWLDRRGKDD